MKKIWLALILIACVFSLDTTSVAGSQTRSASKTITTRSKKQGNSYSRNFYRSLSKRRSNNRADYPHLTDKEFANFRAVVTTGIGKGKLYRSSSPINPWGNRNIIADNAARAAGIRTFVNLADTEKRLVGYKGFQDSYYSIQSILRLNLNWKYQSEKFKTKLAKGISLMAHSQPPFLIHCDAGKDRAGFVCAILECLMGASVEEVTADYLVSFYNYFGTKPGTKDYNFIANNEIRASLALAFGVKNINGINLSAAAERYLLRIGVPNNDIAALRRKLGP
ncbi:MAG: tyrosine-protein phosphatase [Bacteroidales bacterium]|nr:tyrosine-protein phosphatase [Bacteroidales bacterium]